MANVIDVRYNKNNEIIKYQFFQKLAHKKEGKKKPKTFETIRSYANAIHEYEVSTKFKDFKKYTYNDAIQFKYYILDKKNKNTGETISESTFTHYLGFVYELFAHLIANDKNFKHITQNDIDYITPDQNTSNIATQRREPKSYLISEILSTIRSIKGNTPFELRDKAMISLVLLTGARIEAMMTARMDTIFYSSQYKVWIFEQDPKKGVNTKNRKYIYSCFVGNTQDLINNIIIWQEYLINQGFDEKDPFFPQMNSTFTKEGLYATQLNKITIESDSWVRESVFKKSFIKNGLKYIKPHNFRHTLTRAVKKMPNGVEFAIALAQNFGQKNEMPVLYSSYGGDYIARQVELLSNFPLE